MINMIKKFQLNHFIITSINLTNKIAQLQS